MNKKYTSGHGKVSYYVNEDLEIALALISTVEYYAFLILTEELGFRCIIHSCFMSLIDIIIA